MTFLSTETSGELGEPLELYSFNFGAQTLRYTNYDVDVEFQGAIYFSRQISHTDVEVANEQEINNVEIQLPSDDELARKYIAIVPGKKGKVLIVKTHRSEIGGTEEGAVVFEGFIANAKYSGTFKCVFKCKPESLIFNRPGPRFQYTALCNNVLFDAGCKVNPAAFKTTGLVSAVNGDIVTINGISGFGGTFFTGGFTEFPPDTGDDFRMVLSQSGDNVRLLLPFAENILGQEINVFAGCAHDPTTCNTKFSNIINFGGFPYIPRKNPFNSELR